jgi:hypothetical protein
MGNCLEKVKKLEKIVGKIESGANKPGNGLCGTGSKIQFLVQVLYKLPEAVVYFPSGKPESQGGLPSFSEGLEINPPDERKVARCRWHLLGNDRSGAKTGCQWLHTLICFSFVSSLSALSDCVMQSSREKDSRHYL